MKTILDNVDYSLLEKQYRWLLEKCDKSQEWEGLTNFLEVLLEERETVDEKQLKLNLEVNNENS